MLKKALMPLEPTFPKQSETCDNVVICQALCALYEDDYRKVQQ